MTKKSQARQLRDSQLKDARQEADSQIKGNKIYDDIGGVYKTCAETLVGYASSFNQLCVPELIPHMSQEQQQKVGTLTKAIKKDIDVFTHDLLKINIPFKDKAGGEAELEEYINTIGVIDQFAEFIGRCKGTLDPTFNALASEISVVIDKIEPPSQSLQEQQDPSVVTDVQPRLA